MFEVNVLTTDEYGATVLEIIADGFATKTEARLYIRNCAPQGECYVIVKSRNLEVKWNHYLEELEK